jgi:hypothetical protein
LNIPRAVQLGSIPVFFILAIYGHHKFSKWDDQDKLAEQINNCQSLANRWETEKPNKELRSIINDLEIAVKENNGIKMGAGNVRISLWRAGVYLDYAGLSECTEILSHYNIEELLPTEKRVAALKTANHTKVVLDKAKELTKAINEAFK